MSNERSPDASKEEMQLAIDILRVRGDSLLTITEAQAAVLRDIKVMIETVLASVEPLHLKMKELDDGLNIDVPSRRANAIVVARRILGKRGESMTDEDILKAVGNRNGQ